MLPSKEFSRQFSHIYLRRLHALKQAMADLPEGSVLVNKVIDIKSGDKGVIFGTLYKDQPLRQNVVDKVSGLDVGLVYNLTIQ